MNLHTRIFLPTLVLLCAGTPTWAATVKGHLVERSTGNPIEDAEVRIADKLLTTTAEKGRFSIELEDGTHTILFETLDHLPKEISLTVPIDRPIRVFLEPIQGPLEIIVEAFKPSPHTNRHRVDAEMAYETPGTHDDSVRLVQSLPGVMVQREFSPTSGDLSVRASKPGDNRYFLDGIEIPYLYHFNQYASVFPTSQIGELNLYSSTFGAEYGDAIGAVIDAKSKTTRPETLHGGLTFNTIMVGADVRVPIGKRWWASGSYRRSYHDIAGNSNPQYLIWPRFSDYAARIEQGDAKRGTGFFVIGARDRYTRAAGELDLLDPLEAIQSNSFAYQRQFQIWGLRHRFQGNTFGGHIVLGYTREKRFGILEGVGFEAQATNTLTQRLDLNGRISKSILWNAGWEIRRAGLGLTIEGADPLAILVQKEAPGLARGADVDLTQGRTRMGAYGQLQVSAGDLKIFPGVRVSIDPMTETVRTSPRLSARWQLGDQTAVKFAFGHYSQAPRTEWLLPKTGTPSLSVPESWQVTMGLEQTIANRLELQLDGYHKWVQDPIMTPVGTVPVSGKRGQIAGLEAVMRYRLRDHFFLWGWFGWSSSRIIDNAGQRLIGDYDQPISGGLVASWDPTKHWNIALRYRIGSGLPYTPVVNGLYNAGLDRYEPTPGVYNSARMPLYQKVDGSIGYTAYFNRWTLNLRAELWVVPKNATQLYPTHNFDFTDTEWVTGIPFMPLIGARATF